MTIQERWDGTFDKLDRTCPAQRADEAQVDYLRRLCRIGRRYIPAGEEIARSGSTDLPDEVVPKFSELMRAAVERNLYARKHAAGRDAVCAWVDPKTGAKQRHWIGPHSSFATRLYGHRDCRRVIRIRARRVDFVGRRNAATKRAAVWWLVGFPPCQVGRKEGSLRRRRGDLGGRG